MILRRGSLLHGASRYRSLRLLSSWSRGSPGSRPPVEKDDDALFLAALERVEAQLPLRATVERPAPVEDARILHALKTAFGFDSFRQGQREVVGAIMRNENALAVFPTGGGKSLCYMLPAIMLEVRACGANI
jgi:hypothetical protein